MMATAYMDDNGGVLGRRWHVAVRLIACFVLACSSLALYAQDAGERLLGASVTSGLKLKWRQDGRVLELSVAVPDGLWVVQRLELVTVIERNVPSPPPRKGKLDFMDFLQQLDVEAARRTERVHQVKVNGYPGRATSVHLELESDEQLSDVFIREARGRELTRLDKIREAFR